MRLFSICGRLDDNPIFSGLMRQSFYALLDDWCACVSLQTVNRARQRQRQPIFHLYTRDHAFARLLHAQDPPQPGERSQTHVGLHKAQGILRRYFGWYRTEDPLNSSFDSITSNCVARLEFTDRLSIWENERPTERSPRASLR